MPTAEEILVAADAMRKAIHEHQEKHNAALAKEGFWADRTAMPSLEKLARVALTAVNVKCVNSSGTPPKS